jgi:Circularly permutated YpsA SLOG family
MLQKIISGGQGGTDQAAWRAARSFRIPTGGWMRTGFLTDEGRRPEFAEEFAARELRTDNEPACTERNVQDSDATLWFGQTTTARAHATVAACLTLGKPYMPVYPGASFDPSHVATWIAEYRIKTLNVVGNREHEEPGIGDRVEQFLGDVLEHLGHGGS